MLLLINGVEVKHEGTLYLSGSLVRNNYFSGAGPHSTIPYAVLWFLGQLVHLVIYV